MDSDFKIKDETKKNFDYVYRLMEKLETPGDLQHHDIIEIYKYSLAIDRLLHASEFTLGIFDLDDKITIDFQQKIQTYCMT